MFSSQYQSEYSVCCLASCKSLICHQSYEILIFFYGLNSAFQHKERWLNKKLVLFSYFYAYFVYGFVQFGREVAGEYSWYRYADCWGLLIRAKSSKQCCPSLCMIDLSCLWLQGWWLISPPNSQWKLFWLPGSRPRWTSSFFCFVYACTAKHMSLNGNLTLKGLKIWSIFVKKRKNLASGG